MKRALAALGVALLIGGCDELKPNIPGAAARGLAAELARKRELRRACGSQASFERLKVLTFAQAKRSAPAPAAMDRLAGTTIVRMEEPVVTGRDDALGITRCAGRLILELPPGAERAFGSRRLAADVAYAAQEAADGSGLVFRLRRAEPLARRLAMLAPAPQVAAARPAVLPVPTPTPTPEARPSPKPSPTPTPVAKPRPKPSPMALAAAKPKETRAEERARKVETRPKLPAAAPAKKSAARPAAKKRDEMRVAAKPVRKQTADRVARAAPKKPERAAARPAATRVAARPVREKAENKAARTRLATLRTPARPAAKATPTRRPDACNDAETRADRLVCQRPALARAQQRAGAAFRAALARSDADTRDALRASSRRFIRYRDRCATSGCLAQAYADRVDEIRDIARGRY